MDEIQNDLNQMDNLMEKMRQDVEGLSEEEKMRAEEAMKHIHKGMDMMKDQS